MSNSATVFKYKLRLYRELNNFSQEKLAELAKISKSFVAELEMGRRAPTFATIDKLAEALRIQPFQLFYQGTDQETVLLNAFAESMIKSGSALMLTGFTHPVEDKKKEVIAKKDPGAKTKSSKK